MAGPLRRPHGGRHSAPLIAEDLPINADWEIWRTQWVAQRRTDRFLTTHPRIRTRPLPASFQLLGATAALWALIDARLAHCGVHIDRTGVTGRVCETYPRAALAAWKHTVTPKADAPQLAQTFPFLSVPKHLRSRLNNDDVCDAVVCAMVARAQSLGLTIRPSREDHEAATREGWIHVTMAPPTALLPQCDPRV